MNRIISSFFIALLFPLMCSAQDLSSNGEREPFFLSSMNDTEYDFDYYVYTHFKYPHDQMMDRYLTSVGIKMVIGADGKVINVEVTDEDVHESVKTELIPILKKTIWAPAQKNFKPVAFQLEKRVFIVNPYSLIPYDTEVSYRKITPFIGGRHFKNGFTENDIVSIKESFAEMYDKFPLSIEINIPYSIILARERQYAKACEVLDMGFKECVTTSDNGKAEIYAKLLSGIFKSKQGNVEGAKVDFDEAKRMIDHHLNGQPLGSYISMHYLTPVRRIYSLSMYDYEDAYRIYDEVGESQSNTMYYVRERLGDNYLYKKWNKKLFYEGKYNRRNLFKNNLATGNLSEIDYKLIAIYSLILGLEEGKNAEDNWLKSLYNGRDVASNAKIQIKKIHTKILNSNITYEQVINEIFSFVPICETGLKKKIARSKVKEFYRHRQSINDVYPIEWLANFEDLKFTPFMYDNTAIIQ